MNALALLTDVVEGAALSQYGERQSALRRSPTGEAVVMTLTEALAQVQRHIRVSAATLERRYQRAPRAWDAADLRQEGTLAALQAWPQFDPAGGATWRTYADRRITGAMWDFVRRQQHHPRTGDDPQRFTRQLARTTRAHLGWRQWEAQRQVEQRHDLRVYLAPCTARECAILEAHATGERLHAIGARLGITESRVSQLRTAVLRRVQRRAA